MDRLLFSLNAVPLSEAASDGFIPNLPGAGNIQHEKEPELTQNTLHTFMWETLVLQKSLKLKHPCYALLLSVTGAPLGLQKQRNVSGNVREVLPEIGDVLPWKY